MIMPKFILSHYPEAKYSEEHDIICLIYRKDHILNVFIKNDILCYQEEVEEESYYMVGNYWKANHRYVRESLTGLSENELLKKLRNAIEKSNFLRKTWEHEHLPGAMCPAENSKPMYHILIGPLDQP